MSLINRRKTMKKIIKMKKNIAIKMLTRNHTILLNPLATKAKFPNTSNNNTMYLSNSVTISNNQTTIIQLFLNPIPFR